MKVFLTLPKNLFGVLALFLMQVAPVSAQVQPNNETNKLVANVTEAFFDLLPMHDYSSERAFMADHFATIMTLEKWRAGRKSLLDQIETTPRYTAHNLTYYQQEHLLAAVDFSAKTTQSNTYVCGYILWELPTAQSIGFTRLEQGIIKADHIQRMDLAKAVQLMTDWHCPSSMIETILNIKLRK